MKNLKKSNRVSWPPDADLCQVWLFSSDDCPSVASSGVQDQLHERTSWILRSNPMDSDHPPPGFDRPRDVNRLQRECPRIPKMNWKSPPKFILSPSWQVAAGEESTEVGLQKHRESRVLEAVYPSSFSIPSSPSVSPDLEECDHDDRTTPIIPLTPIEEDDTAPNPNVCTSEETVLPPRLDADTIAAASAAFTAIMKSCEQGSMVDTNLLIKILTNPKLVEKLIMVHKLQAPPSSSSNLDTMTKGVQPTTSTTHVPKPVAPIVALACPQLSTAPPSNRVWPDPLTLAVASASPQLSAAQPPDRVWPNPLTPVVASSSPQLSMASPPNVVWPNFVTPMVALASPQPSTVPPPSRDGFVPSGSWPNSVAVSSSRPWAPVSTANQVSSLPQEPNGVPPSAAVSVYTPAIMTPPLNGLSKDCNYYKNLIKWHGGDRISQGEQLQASKLLTMKEDKPKTRKPCIYYNSSRGCRLGSACSFLHLKGYAEKRMKME